jgi:para-aminobenzoate synthetase / 4-amino-4-deoxychorismate lyase
MLFPMLKLPKSNFVFLETNRFDRDNCKSYLFFNPLKIITAYEQEDINPAFIALERYISRGYYVAGFISYEAGFSFEEGLKNLKTSHDFPLLWFGIYKKPRILRNNRKIKKSSYNISNLYPNISEKDYIRNIRKIKGFIRSGDTYQVNYTFKYKFDLSGSPLGLYNGLREKQKVSYSAFVNSGDFTILSFSPELFFRKHGNDIEVRPMKGTLDRGVSLKEDKRNMEALADSLKNRSENVMIVDLLRNDLGRVCGSGTVRTVRLFEVEKYETLLQMISVIKGRLKDKTGLHDLFKAIFPSGSVTGAPKINTMKIIDTLEPEPRNVYTGGIGFIAPDKSAVFNVAIRTLLINNKTKKGEMGIGSGIVYDSDPRKEFQECGLKADFITKSSERFDLIETILWHRRKGYFLLKLHLDRLADSAGYFDFKYDRKHIKKRLAALEKKFNKTHDYKIRVLLSRDEKVRTGFSVVHKPKGTARVVFSDKRVSSRDPFFYHKTTNRKLYDGELRKWRKKGYFDAIFSNEKNQITEGAISNIIIKKGRVYYTPPVNCGLLRGVYREYLLKSKKIHLKEKILHKSDIIKADKIYIVNSVHGMVEVVL